MKRPYRKSKRHRFAKTYRTQHLAREQWQQLLAILMLALSIIVGSRILFEFVYGSYQGRWDILPVYIITRLMETVAHVVAVVIGLFILLEMKHQKY